MSKDGFRMIAIMAALLVPSMQATVAQEQSDKAAGEQAQKPKSDAIRQIESGTDQISRGLEQAAKGVVQGSKEVGHKIGEAAKEAEPQAKTAWENFKTAAVDAGVRVKTFLARLFER